jgi:hypothetical protein
MEKFFGSVFSEEMVESPEVVRQKESHHVAVSDASSWRRMERGNIWRPSSFPVSEPMWRARLKNLGLAMETKIV